MKRERKNKTFFQKMYGRAVQSAANGGAADRMKFAAVNSPERLYEALRCGEHGIRSAEAEERREKYGANVIRAKKKRPLAMRLIDSFFNSFSAILFVLALVSVFTDIVFAPAGEKNPTTVIIIGAMLVISGVLRFVQDTRSDNAAERLSKMVTMTATAERDGARAEIPPEEIVVGDVIHLSAGDMIPADMRIVSCKDLFVSQASLTGESAPVEKTGATADESTPVPECENLAFMGSNVVSGSGRGIVVAVGSGTLFGRIAKTLDGKPPKTAFQTGIGKVSGLLIRFMLVMVPIVLLINGFTKGDWLQALLFAVSVAVGLTPEMLPMIVTAALAKGSVAMSKKKVIVKKLNSIQDLGAIDILCTDKTGTLTQDKVVLEKHMNVHGDEDDRVLRHAWLNSYYQTGLKNLIDIAVIEKFAKIFGSRYDGVYTKVDEIPFDFERRRMSVIISDESGKCQLIAKGAVEEMLECCSFAEYGGNILPLTEELKNFVLAKADALNAEGMRVIAVAQKNASGVPGAFTVADESDMVLIGYLAFLDPPKPTAAKAISDLFAYGVRVKILTGDNEKVAASICKQVGLDSESVLLGADVDAYDDAALAQRAEEVTVFAKLSPEQKARVVRVLRERGHAVGYMGDGINDAAAMKQADVGISVDTAVDIAKESADIILLEKDLTVLKHGIAEGRKTYANTIKYVKMTASSNFGNMFSVLAASAFLPFLPMTAIQLVLLNLVYDVSCTAIPWDNVDEDFLRKPRKWEAKSVGKFMLYFGPVSSVFDITTFAALYFLICPAACGGSYASLGAEAQEKFAAIFRAGWFIESMWTQALIIHLIRTPRVPFIQSRASLSVTLLTAAGTALITAIPYTPLGSLLGFYAPSPSFFALLAVTVIAYIALATAVKALYVKRYGELL